MNECNKFVYQFADKLNLNSTRPTPHPRAPKKIDSSIQVLITHREILNMHITTVVLRFHLNLE